MTGVLIQTLVGGVFLAVVVVCGGLEVVDEDLVVIDVVFVVDLVGVEVLVIGIELLDGEPVANLKFFKPSISA